ncbi:unnamed protein product [Orchesella dallaii]|uniref:Uncharacterized protein n=1 Tax=Orchesella dallaii TaxID=48710 RepID=A0ABP1S1G8_9HEXA
MYQFTFTSQQTEEQLYTQFYCLFRSPPLTKGATTLYETDEFADLIDSPISEPDNSLQDRTKRDAQELQPNFELEYDSSESLIRTGRRIINETDANATYKVMINGTEVDRPRPLKMLNLEYFMAKKKFFEVPAQNATNATVPDDKTSAAPDPAAPDPAAAPVDPPVDPAPDPAATV